MKKVILSALAVVFAFNIASAQEEVVRVTTVTTTNYFKPNQGDVTADLGLFGKGIFSNQSPVNTFDGMLKGRLFLMDDLALRASLSASQVSETNTSNADVTTKTSRGGFGLFAGTMGATLIQQFCVHEEGFRIVKCFQQGRRE